jgi:hypothetical protein
MSFAAVYRRKPNDFSQYFIAKNWYPKTNAIVGHNPRQFFLLFVFKYIADFPG